MLGLTLAAVTFALWIQYLHKRGKGSRTISHIPGPPSPSFLLGNLAQYYVDEVGRHEFGWQRKYGAVYRISGLLGEERLMIADPKTLQHCLQSADTVWLKPAVRRELGRFYLGRGIAWAQGEDHKRHRKILSPAFGNIESRGMMPVFRKIADRMCQHWKNIIDKGDGASADINVADWLSRATLDTIGEAAFHYEFGSLENWDNKLAKSYNSLLVDAFGAPKESKVFIQHMLAHAPIGFFRFIEKLPLRGLKRLRATAEESDRVAQELVQDKMETSRKGVPPSRRDVMDILVQANSSANAASRLSDEELYAQLRTIIAAGHETTGSQLCFILYELAQHPDVQTKLREEVNTMLESIRGRGDTEYTMADLEALKYTLAVMNEALRLHPVVHGPFVVAEKDDVLPLSKPIRDTGGIEISEIAVGRGQYVHLSLAGYNRLEDVWGDDANVFRPERWLDGIATKIDVHFGVYHNLGNFASGNVSCLGWRFAFVNTLQEQLIVLTKRLFSTIEMQTYMVEIFRSFNISYPQTGRRVLRATSGVMAPVLEGEPGKKQLPLSVSLFE